MFALVLSQLPLVFCSRGKWLQQQGVAHVKDMKLKRHSTSRNDIQFENCAVLILVWDHLPEFLNHLEQANRQVGLDFGVSII